MAKVTSKYEVTVPRSIADRYGIAPGDDIEWIPAGDVIRVVPGQLLAPADDVEARLRIFDQARQRHRLRGQTGQRRQPSSRDRGWSREELYDRGRPR